MLLSPQLLVMDTLHLPRWPNEGRLQETLITHPLDLHTSLEILQHYILQLPAIINILTKSQQSGGSEIVNKYCTIAIFVAYHKTMTFLSLKHWSQKKFYDWAKCTQVIWIIYLSSFFYLFAICNISHHGLCKRYINNA